MTEAALFPDADPPPLEFERSLWKTGLRWIAGVDESGRGALAGPVVAAAVISSETCVPLLGQVKDSKKLSPEIREELFDEIQAHSVAVAVGIVSVEEIDRINILRASLQAMRIAVESLSTLPDLCLIDGNMPIPLEVAQQSIIRGDDRIFSISAASIVAKVTRDRLMRKLDREHPNYGFAAHKGYGTEEHLNAISQFGICIEHRRSFAPCKPI
jgi:ribonuclease HII